MELQAFVEMLRRLGPEDLTAVARAIDASHQTAADDASGAGTLYAKLGGAGGCAANGAPLPGDTAWQKAW